MLLALTFLWLLPREGAAQPRQYEAAVVGFYNFENLFDTLDQAATRDEEFTPQGARAWNGRLYAEKLDHLARVVSEIGTEWTPDGAALLGVSEIENRQVLEDFVRHPRLADRTYRIVHFESPDYRGIDVALLYNPRYFQLLSARPLPVPILDRSRTPPDTLRTRDVLFVSGLLRGDTIHLLVNHWPSRRGGEKASEYKRRIAAEVNKRVCDSLNAATGGRAKILLMGDLNDDPASASVREVLGARRKPEQVQPGGFFNPMWAMYRKGVGTLAWNDAWNLFDQILVSYGLLQPEAGFRYLRARVFRPDYLVQKTGRYKGYPFRTFSGDNYIGGYSDHFPVYLLLVRPLPER
ncbi:MAG: endonuclease/exonuclease/phosphatase family protein [Bacteroidetes bacterium]|nr:MAG: endonuclease/exonuclease/phosphatase family protein [Bacteroidota bacterium]